MSTREQFKAADALDASHPHPRLVIDSSRQDQRAAAEWLARAGMEQEAGARCGVVEVCIECGRPIGRPDWGKPRCECGHPLTSDEQLVALHGLWPVEWAFRGTGEGRAAD